MPLPEEVIALFNDPAARKTLSTLDEENTIHAAPFGSLCASPDGSMLMFTQGSAEETPRRLRHMKGAGKIAVVVVQLIDREKNLIKGYSVRCKVGDALTSGPLYDRACEETMKRFGVKARALWTLHPVSYKIHSLGPDRGKTIIL